MSRNQRSLGLIAAVVVIAVVAFIVAKPGSNDDKTSNTQASTSSSQSGGSKTETTGGSEPATPAPTRIAIKGDGVEGGVKTITVKKGDPVSIVVTVDKLHHLHLHGWDIEKDATPDKPAKFNVTAKNEGEFELESHTFEHEGLEAGLAKIRVEPS